MEILHCHLIMPDRDFDYVLLMLFVRSSRYLSISFSHDKEVEKDGFVLFGDLIEGDLAAHCHILDLRKCKSVYMHEPFELTLDTRDSQQVLQRDDIQITFLDTKSGLAGKSKIIDRNDGTFAIRLMALTHNAHTLVIQVKCRLV